MTITHAAPSGSIDLSEWEADHIGGLPVASVVDYGATGDGSTDDTTAIADAIADVAASGGVAYFPSGTYITSPIEVPPGATLQGVTGQAYYNATTTVPNANTISRLKLKSGSTGPLISPDDGGATLATAVRICDLALDCNGIAQSAINLPDQGGSISRFWRMERLYINNIGNVSGGYAVYVGNLNTACRMTDCTIFNGTSGSQAGGDAVGWYGQDGIMDNCWIGYFSGNGLTVLGGSSSTFLQVRGGGIFTCTTGVVVGGTGAVFEGVSIDHNFNDGIYIGYDCTLVGCWFHTNSRTTTNTWSNIRIANPVQVGLFGCRAEPRGGETSNNPKYHIEAHATCVLNQSGNTVASGVTFGTAYSNYTGTTTAPTFPATTVAATNTKGADVVAYIANSTSAITAVTIGSTVTGIQIAANGYAAIPIPMGQSIKFTYGGGSPTWTWVLA